MTARRAYRKLSLVGMATFFCVTLFLLVGEQWYFGRQDIVEDMTALAKIVATNASAALMFGDEKAGEEILQALAHAPNLAEAGLYRQNGMLLASYRKPAMPLAEDVPLAEILRGPNPGFSLREVRLFVPVFLRDKAVGAVVIRGNQDELYKNLWRFIVGYILIIVCAFGLATLATHKLRQRVVVTERIFDSFVNSSPAGMAVLDRDLRYLRINRALAELSGDPMDSHLGRTVGEVLPGLSPVIEKYHRQVLETGLKRDVEFSDKAHAAPGEIHHWLNSFFPIRDADERIIASGWVALDITEREKAEIARREIEGRLKALTDNLPVVLFQLVRSVGAEICFTYLSDNLADLTGIPVERLLIDHRLLLAAMGEQGGADFASLFLAPPKIPGTPVIWTGKLRHAEGDEVWLEIRANPRVDANGTLTASGVMVDVTRLRHYQEEIERSRQLLQRLMSHREALVEKEYKKIAGEIHDDLGQVLTAALMRLRLLKRKMPTAALQEGELIDGIDGLLNEAYARLKDIAATLRPVALSFGFVPAIEWLANRILGPSTIKYHLDIDAALPKMAESMSVALFRIIQESLTNAVRHAEAENIWISLAAVKDEWVLSIKDDGRGFQDDELGKSLQFGLLGIRERAISLGGLATITGTPGQGVEIKVAVPRPTID